jgi:hypothetical protein
MELPVYLYFTNKAHNLPNLVDDNDDIDVTSIRLGVKDATEVTN